MLQAPPLALYVHIPWCVRKCPYCDFNSHEQKGTLPQTQYVQALLADLAEELALLESPRPIDSIFIGGGTPSLFDPDQIGCLLSGIDRLCPLTSDCEITLEANPGTHEHGRFSAYRTAGVNRVSLGIQSLNAGHLQRLGRIHDPQQAKVAIEDALGAGFNSVNLDLMFGLPEQSLEQALADLQQAIAFGSPHLSWYQLTLEPNTPFYRQPPPLPDDDSLIAMQEAGQALLAAAGLEQYEVSAYARSGYQCRHNRHYWTFSDYLGIGAGAHAKLTLPGQDQILRRHKQRHPKQYLEAGNRLAGERRLDRDDRILEFMLNALRLKEGVPLALFGERTGLDTDCLTPYRQAALAEGLLEERDDWLQASPLGWLHLNALLTCFYPDPD